MTVFPFVAGLWFLTQVSPQGASPDSSWNRFLDLLFTKRIDAHVHLSLISKYRSAGNKAEDIPETEAYSRARFPVVIGKDEEWPSLLSGAEFLLDDPLFGQVLGAGEAILKEGLEKHSHIERVLFQNELWSAFDILYFERNDLGEPEGRNAWGRRRKLMKMLAALIKKVALSDLELSKLPSSEEVREFIFFQNGMSESKPVEFYSTETFLFHDFAHRFRRSNHFFFWDAKRRLETPTGEEIAGLNERSLGLSRGSIALIEEDIIAISSGGALVPTKIPGLFKVYTIDGASEEAPSTFALYKMDRAATELSHRFLTALPKETEAWARIDLPTMPGRRKPPYRSPLSISCAGCHGIYPNAFAPFNQKIDVAHYRFTQTPQNFSARRNASIKRLSAEFYMLASSMASIHNGGVVSAASPGGGDADEPDRFGASRFSPASVVTLLLCLGIVIATFANRRRRKGSTS
jgi:hypothetical protein